MRAPNKFTVEEIKQYHVKCEVQHDTWVYARPLGYSSIFRRLKYTWLVFSGKADIIIWKGV